MFWYWHRANFGRFISPTKRVITGALALLYHFVSPLLGVKSTSSFPHRSFAKTDRFAQQAVPKVLSIAACSFGNRPRW
jgi:hypothetical protein